MSPRPRLRPVREEEFSAWSLATERAFGKYPDDDEIAVWRRRVELPRTLVAWDGDEVVATGANLGFALSVPGGEVPCAGVTAISVAPTHRRQGLLRSMMGRLLADARDHGDPVAALWASEASIYGRFGFGCAAWRSDWTAPRAAGAGLAAPAGMRLVDADTALAAFPGLYDAVRSMRGGMPSWTAPAWEASLVRDDEAARRGPRQFALLEDRAAAAFRVKPRWDRGMPASELAVELLLARDPEAEIGIWAFLFGVDLVAGVRAELRPVDEPLLLRLPDLRPAQPSLLDALWVRLIDVRAALAGRAYGSDGRLVLEVSDPLLADNTATFRLEVSGGEASCRRVRNRPDLRLDVAALGAAYLGGTSFSRLAAAGLVSQERPDALGQADALFGSGLAPWCPFIF